ncbi:MAG: hypothetical protein L0221_14630, partial [Chloroflexi bacterium]|nr:hypothetical protein [Chloroflexota bacterium]
MRHWRSLFDLADDVALRDDDILALQPDTFLVSRIYSGSDRASGGAYENWLLALFAFGADALMTRVELFDPDRAAEALARFDQLVTAAPAVRFENAATRWCVRLTDAWDARDWGRVAAGYAPGFRCVERRKMVRLELDREANLESLRLIFGMQASRLSARVIATRGDRLALHRWYFEGSGRSVGPMEVEFLQVTEVDNDGDAVAMVMFDPDDVDAAYAELDARYLAGEGAPYARTWEVSLGILQAIAARDWERLAAGFAPGFVTEDHRPLGLLGSLSGDAYVASVRALLELRPDARLRTRHALALDDRRSLTVQAWEGDESEGAFESAAAMVMSYGVDGIRQWHAYSPDQLDAARACYENLGPKAPLPRIENAATRSWDRFMDAWKARDWERVAAGFAPGLRVMDRRKMVRIELDRSGQLETLRFAFEMRSSRITAQLLATRGDRLALHRICFYISDGDDGDAGPSEIEFLHVSEVDDHGDLAAMVALDPDDLDAAYAQLDERYLAGEAAPYARNWQAHLRVGPAVDARDWEQLASVFAPDFVMADHRLLGLLPSSGTEYVASVRALVDLKPDTRFRVDHALALDDRRSLTVMGWVGGEQDGTFEIRAVAVTEHALDGTRRRQHFYDLDQLDEAWARFHALGEGGRTEGAPREGRPDAARDPLAALAKPNTAAAARDRAEAAFEARDWAAFRALYVAEAKIEDRRRHVLVSHGVEELIADRQRWARSAFHQERRLVATAGDRVALERVLATLGPPDGRSEFEGLRLTEVDEDGRILSTVAFDLDDWRAANAEAFARALAVDAAAAFRPIYEFALGLNDHDLARMRDALADDLVVHDHRRAGLGLVEGADA